MARKVKWTPRAASLLELVTRRLAKDSPSGAAKVASDLLDAAETLSEFSNRGREVPEIASRGFRELLVGEYRLVYRVRSDEVQIVAVVHGARDFRTWWRRSRRSNS